MGAPCLPWWGLGVHPHSDPWGVAFGADYCPDRARKAGSPISGCWTYALDGIQGDADFIAAIFSLSRPMAIYMVVHCFYSLQIFPNRSWFTHQQVFRIWTVCVKLKPEPIKEVIDTTNAATTAQHCQYSLKMVQIWHTCCTQIGAEMHSTEQSFLHAVHASPMAGSCGHTPQLMDLQFRSLCCFDRC